jgi:hypothetical protein
MSPTSARPSPTPTPPAASQVADVLVRLTERLGPTVRPTVTHRGLNVTFANVSTREKAPHLVLEDLGAVIQYVGKIPQVLSGSHAFPLCTGLFGDVAFTARSHPTGPDAVNLEIQLLAAVESAEQGANVSGAYLLIDEILGSQVSPELLAGYLSHQLTKLKGKARARLAAELASVVAEHLHEVSAK